MPRKRILAAIGGGEAAGPEVETFGKLVAHVGAILMTGGIPNRWSSRVTERAQAGCEAAGGLTISVLPGRDRNEVVPCSNQRRFEVRTKVSKFGRDPITGAAADMIFAFRGDVGTLVELAYASDAGRPIVFCGTEHEWNEMANVRETKRLDIRAGIETAVREYGPASDCRELTPDQITQNAIRLEQALDQVLKRNLRTTAHFLESFSAVYGPPAQAATYFRGLPDCRGTEEFRDFVDRLSAFGPAERFP